ncbi:acyl-CoA thioesterase [Rhodospirillaceae bacterium KN72]|uniref:Acyl-CoA thioesterase n=1 Tax=Pacificispira spongiicola TaxID=2729598 RepID=A0A7Y0HI22_9PROT|nr:acyl-CoA thioesterase [Pacificispira spongiicola]NMM46059.1 acyl-CoA thioesterase [Pacificispira spongiicola]
MGQNQEQEPRGELQIRTLAMPSDTNPSGDIFGGWVLSQMDIAGGILAGHRAKGRVATVAVDGMTFHLPVFVGDIVCCYADVVRVGRTSIAINVQTWALRANSRERMLVTEGVYTYVAIGQDRKPRVIGG